MAKKERTYVNRRLVRQLEDQVQSLLGQNYGFRRAMDVFQTMIEQNKKEIKKIQEKINYENKGILRGIPVEPKK